jgi:hypothetical protein
VAAETIGTNTVIASSQVQTSGCAPPFNNGACYTLMLPAAGTFGTLYDLAVAGGGDTYAAARLPPLYAGGQVIGPQNPPLKVTAATSLGSITGSVMDACTASTPIVGATLQLLVPPFTVMNPSPTFCLDTPQQCVSVASANTDNAGNFPLPGTVTVSPQFLNVPAAPSGNLNGAYAMEITAPGYDPLIVQAKPSNGRGGGKCALVGTNTFNSCKLSLSTAFISGTIPINTPLPGQPTLVQVFAEPTGTNDIQSSLPMPITVRNPNSSVNFTLKVPSQIPTFDLFATTIDLFQGVTDPFQGHDIVVLSGVKQPGLCQTNSTADFDPTQPITCVGHGTVLGQAFNANLGASVVLSKQDTSAPPGTFVQITNAQIQNQQGAAAPSPANSYAFCAPADTYQLQPVQLPQPQPGETPVMSPTAMPTGDAVIVTIPQPPFFHSPTGSLTPTATPSGPTPTATATPKVTCPTICSKPDGSCPGVCVPMNQPLTIPSLPPLLPTPTATATM